MSNVCEKVAKSAPVLGLLGLKLQKHMKTTVKKINKKTVSQLKKICWKYFSEYIRLRDCLSTTGTLTHGICVTCQKRYSFKELQAGHLLDGRSGLNLFDERGCFAQCMSCNVWLHGNKEKYIPWFLDTYGDKLYKELQVQKRKTKNWKTWELEEKIEEIKKEIEYIKNL